jgi:hypothetical protein
VRVTSKAAFRRSPQSASTRLRTNRIRIPRVFRAATGRPFALALRRAPVDEAGPCQSRTPRSSRGKGWKRERLDKGTRTRGG